MDGGSTWAREAVERGSCWSDGEREEIHCCRNDFAGRSTTESTYIPCQSSALPTAFVGFHQIQRKVKDSLGLWVRWCRRSGYITVLVQKGQTNKGSRPFHLTAEQHISDRSSLGTCLMAVDNLPQSRVDLPTSHVSNAELLLTRQMLVMNPNPPPPPSRLEEAFRLLTSTPPPRIRYCPCRPTSSHHSRGIQSCGTMGKPDRSMVMTQFLTCAV